eukprot:scaffold7956_cov32-Tisochrysis_lutea.AAC.3
MRKAEAFPAMADVSAEPVNVHFWASVSVISMRSMAWPCLGAGSSEAVHNEVVGGDTESISPPPPMSILWSCDAHQGSERGEMGEA